MHVYILHTKISSRYHSVLMTIFCGWPVAILFKKPLHELLGRPKCRCPFVLLNFELCDIVADEVVETPYVVCKTTVLTVELIGNNRHVSITSCIELHKDKMHAIARLYWIRTNVSSIAASALATKLIARMVDNIMLFAVMHLWMAERTRLARAHPFGRLLSTEFQYYYGTSPK